MSYEQLRNLPLINGVTVVGDRTLSDYGVVPLSSEEVTEILLEVFGYIL